MDRRALGNKAEAHARDYLCAQGLQIIHANFNCKVGELDIIAMDKNVLVVVEVRSRVDMGYGNAAASIDRRKRAKIIRATQYFLLKHRELRRFPVRFDVVTLDKTVVNAEPQIKWMRRAFTADS